MIARALAATPLTLLMLAGCPAGAPTAQIALGVDNAFVETGLGEAVRVAFEQHAKRRVRLVTGTSGALEAKARAGEIDVLLVASDQVAEALLSQGVAVRDVVVGHEELVFIGPADDKVRAHGFSDGSALIQNLSRFNMRFYKGEPSSVEGIRAKLLFRASKDFEEASSFRSVKGEGVEVVKAAVDGSAFALVRRSSIVLAKAKLGIKPQRVYHDGWADLVVRIHAMPIHQDITKRAPDTTLIDYLDSPEMVGLITRFGASRFGIALYAPGEPPKGKGASVPGMDAARKKLEAETATAAEAGEPE